MNHQDASELIFFRCKQRARMKAKKRKKRRKKKRKRRNEPRTMKRLAAIQSDPTDFDEGKVILPAKRRRASADIITSAHIATKLIFPLLLLLMEGAKVESYCPLKCHCDNQLLLANCTQVGSITIVPMTLNPLLKRLTLSQLPMAELGNSLSVYRQLEYLNLSSNQLRQIRYDNFNSKAPPASLLVHHNNHNGPSSNSLQQHQVQAKIRTELNANNQQLARQLKQSLDRSLEQAASPGASQQQPASSNGDEIRFHLRELDLSDNRIEQLGSLFDHQPEEGVLSDEQVQLSGRHRLKSADLERLAPFLTLTKLSWLSLAGNRLVRLHQHVFLGLVHLKALDLSRNQLEVLDKHAFVSLIELERLDLSDNRLARQFQPLGLALCRAPMNELEQLDLSKNVAEEFQSTPDILLPNQIFICAPKLRWLNLSWLRLRYVQVNAFDNLHQLERLDLSHNLLEQVPSESLTSISSNLSESLQQLDLSDTQIDFVPAGAFAGLRSLQKLTMNQMTKLVSFDLASLVQSPTVRLEDRTWSDPTTPNVDQLVRADGNFRAAVKSLLPEHLLDRIVQPSSLRWNSPEEQPSDDGLPANYQLQQLQLRHNGRLQSFHSSLAAKMRFAKLRLLDLSGPNELREVALEKMIDFGHLHPGATSEQSADGRTGHLLVDLSFATNLNCSSCQMSWLIGAAQRVGAKELHDPIELLSAAHSLGCLAPLSLTLGQLIELDPSLALLLGHCRRAEFQFPTEASTTVSWQVGQVNEELGRRQDGDSSGATIAMMLAALCMFVALLLVGGKLVASRNQLKLHSASLDSPNGTDSSPTSSSSAIPAAFVGRRYDAEQLGGGAAMFQGFANFYRQQQQQQQQQQHHQHQHQHQQQQPNSGTHFAGWLQVQENQRGNLFSRIVGQLRGSRASGDTGNICRNKRAAPAKQLPPLPLPVQVQLASSSPQQRRHTHIIENVVYGGDKISAGASLLAANQQSCYFLQRRQDSIKPPVPFGVSVAAGANQQPLRQSTRADGFIRGDAAAASPQPDGSLVYANCYQELSPNYYSLEQLVGRQQNWSAAAAAAASAAYGETRGETCRRSSGYFWPERVEEEVEVEVEGGASCESATFARAAMAAATATATTTATTTTTTASYDSSASSAATASSTARLTTPHELAAGSGQLHLAQEDRRPQVEPRGGKPLLAAAAASGHIYVTLDRPIKQRNGRDEYNWQANKHSEQDGNAPSGQWSSNGAATEMEPERCSSGRLMPEEALKRKGGQFKLNNRSSHLSDASQTAAEQKSQRYASSEWSPEGNVTSHTKFDGSDSAAASQNSERSSRRRRNQQQQQQQQLFMGKLNGFAEQTGVGMMDGASRSKRPQFSNKYDANHAADQRHAQTNTSDSSADYGARCSLPAETAFDNDYVINGLNLGEPKQLQPSQQQPQTATTIADSLDLVKRRSMGVVWAADGNWGESADDDNNGDSGGRREDGRARMENGNSIMIGQQDPVCSLSPPPSCDNLGAETGESAATNKPRSAQRLRPDPDDKGRELGGTSRATGHEIYSNQFYYCKLPTAAQTATATATATATTSTLETQ